MPNEKGVLRHTCTYHCAACNSHFHSLQGFDLHRQGSFRDGSRYCEDPQDVKGLIKLYEDADCDLARPTERNVTVWTGARSLSMLRDLREQPRSAPESLSKAT